MKTILTIVAALAISGAVLAQEVVVDRRGAYTSATVYDAAYDLQTQLTFRGVVTGVQSLAAGPGTDALVSLLVKNDDGGGTTVVELGPAWYVDRQSLRVQLKDAVQVTGSKIMIDGKGVILAKLVQVGTEVLALRRPNGIPYWASSAPLIPLGPDPSRLQNSGNLESYRYFADDGSVYSGTIFRTPYTNVIVDMGPQWFGQPPGFVIPFSANINVGTTGTYWLGSMSGYIPVFRF